MKQSPPQAGVGVGWAGVAPRPGHPGGSLPLKARSSGGECAATQSRKQRAAATKGQARPPGSARGGVARCWRQAPAAQSGPFPPGQQPRRPPGCPYALCRPRAGGAGRGAAGAGGIRRCFSAAPSSLVGGEGSCRSAAPTQRLVAAGRSATPPSARSAPPSPFEIFQGEG